MGEEHLDPGVEFGPAGERFEVEVTGDPSCLTTFKKLHPETVEAGLERNPGIVATALHCVNAIPYVCAAEPGPAHLPRPAPRGRARAPPLHQAGRRGDDPRPFRHRGPHGHRHRRRPRDRPRDRDRTGRGGRRRRAGRAHRGRPRRGRRSDPRARPARAGGTHRRDRRGRVRAPRVADRRGVRPARRARQQRRRRDAARGDGHQRRIHGAHVRVQRDRAAHVDQARGAPDGRHRRSAARWSTSRRVRPA